MGIAKSSIAGIFEGVGGVCVFRACRGVGGREELDLTHSILQWD